MYRSAIVLVYPRLAVSDLGSSNSVCSHNENGLP